jgi:hypothetical protein
MPGGLWWELSAGLVFVGSYALAWLWLGPDPADREIWRRLLKRRNVRGVGSLDPTDKGGSEDRPPHSPRIG